MAVVRGAARAPPRAMSIRRHVHHRRDGIIVLCTKGWCAPSRWRVIACRAFLLALPFALVAASIALGARRFALALTGFAVVALLAGVTGTLDAPVERGGRARPPPERGTSPGTGSVA